MSNKPQTVKFVIFLSLFLFIILFYWGSFALDLLIKIPGWEDTLGTDLTSIFYWVFFIGALIWFGASGLILYLLYGIMKKKSWGLTVTIILSTLMIISFGIMLTGFIAVLLLFQNLFSTVGLITVNIAILVDLALIFFLTRPSTKRYFE